MQQITNWGDAMMASLTSAASMFFLAVPRLLGFAVILIVGWIIASLIGKAAAVLLRAVHFNVAAERAGLTSFIQKSNIQGDATSTISLIAKWFVRLIALVVAFDALGLPAVSQILNQLLLWLPNLVVALVILAVGGIAANALARIALGAATEAGLAHPDFLANVARYAVWAFTILVAVNQLGIATSLINILLMATAGAIALALGLSFGLGGRDTAASIVSRWYQRGLDIPQIRSAGGGAANQMNMLRSYPDTERRSLAADRRASGGLK